MTKIERLKKEARDVCYHAGSHNMRRFTCNAKDKYSSYCKKCGKHVFINANPLPNEIDIYGEAVALGCK